MSKVSTSIFLESRYALSDGTYSIKLRVTHKRKQKYYPTDLSLSKEDFAKAFSLKPNKELKEIKLRLEAVEQKAINIINKMPFFTHEEFEKKYADTSSKENVFDAFNNYIFKLKLQSRIGTAESYTCSRNSLLSFVKKESPHTNRKLSKEKMQAKKYEREKVTFLPFSSITKSFLEDYEHWMISGGKSITTIGIYLRALRTLINDALSSGIIQNEQYPFGRRKYQIPAGNNVKKALTLNEIKSIFNYEPHNEQESKCKDMFIFSYLCNGINIKDIARLKYNNIDGDKIIFIRAKTERTSKKALKPIVAILTPEVKRIINKWGNKSKNPENFVFSILSQGLSPEQEKARIRQAIKSINFYMKRIAKNLSINENITSYYARHSFSTILKKKGVSTAFISESLGHSNESITQNYLDSFEDDTKKEFAALLTNFE